jgi:hypothetical protein
MEETGSLENPIPSGKCYLDLNRAGKQGVSARPTSEGRGRKRGAEGLETEASLLLGTRARDGGGRQNRGKTGLTAQENEPERKKEACTRRAGADDGFSASRCGLSGTANCACAKIGVFNRLTPKGIKRLKTQADEGLTTADGAGYVVLRQPPAAAGEPVQDRCSFLVWPSLGPFLTLDHH